jgi:nitroreductase
MAGSSKNSQPCRFIVMRDRANIERLAAAGDFTAAMRTAPLVIAILLEEGWRPFDVGRAAQNMMLAAWNEGITSCPVGIQHAAEGRKAVGAPDNFEVHMVVCFGYPEPSTPLSRGQKRRDLEDIVRRERW